MNHKKNNSVKLLFKNMNSGVYQLGKGKKKEMLSVIPFSQSLRSLCFLQYLQRQNVIYFAKKTLSLKQFNLEIMVKSLLHH